MSDLVGPTRRAGRTMTTIRMTTGLPAFVAPLMTDLLADHLVTDARSGSHKW